MRLQRITTVRRRTRANPLDMRRDDTSGRGFPRAGNGHQRWSHRGERELESRDAKQRERRRILRPANPPMATHQACSTNAVRAAAGGAEDFAHEPAMSARPRRRAQLLTPAGVAVAGDRRLGHLSWYALPRLAMRSREQGIETIVRCRRSHAWCPISAKPRKALAPEEAAAPPRRGCKAISQQ